MFVKGSTGLAAARLKWGPLDLFQGGECAGSGFPICNTGA